MRRLSFLCSSYLIFRKRNLSKSSLMRCCGAFSHCFVLTLVGAKHTSDFQIHLDIQNLMLVIISNLHKFNKSFVRFTNNAAIFPWYHFRFDILTAILLKNDTKTPVCNMACILVKWTKNMMNLCTYQERICTFQISRWTWEIWVLHRQVSKQNSVILSSSQNDPIKTVNCMTRIL